MELRDIIRRAAPHIRNEHLDLYLPHLEELMKKYGIDTPLRQMHFLAQLLHESGAFSAVRENMNYSADGLLRVFPKYFTPEQAQQYARQPQQIANRVYANRMGNGNEASGDGWRYRGGGLIQTTGKSNYDITGKAIGVDLVRTPERIIEPRIAVESACHFWQRNGLNHHADRDDIHTVTRRINGGLNGLADRQKYYAGLSNIMTA